MWWSLVMPWLAISWPAWCSALIVSGHFSTASPLAPMVALILVAVEHVHQPPDADRAAVIGVRQRGDVDRDLGVLLEAAALAERLVGDPEGAADAPAVRPLQCRLRPLHATMHRSLPRLSRVSRRQGQALAAVEILPGGDVLRQHAGGRNQQLRGVVEARIAFGRSWRSRRSARRAGRACAPSGWRTPRNRHAHECRRPPRRAPEVPRSGTSGTAWPQTEMFRSARCRPCDRARTARGRW